MPLTTTLGEIGVVPNNSVLQGVIKLAEVTGTVTSTWNPRSGGNSKIIVKGTQVQITSLAQECQAAGLEYNITGGHIWTIEIIYYIDIVTNQFDHEPAPISFWEMNYHQIDRSILELTDRPFIAALKSSSKIAIENALKNTIPSAKAPVGPDDTIHSREAKLTYNLKLIGIEGRAQFVPTIKRTAIMSTGYNLSNVAGWNNSFLNSTVMSTSDFLRRYNVGNPLGTVPAFIQSQLPYTLDVYDVRDDTTKKRSGFTISKDGIVTFIGWLQFPIDTQQIAINKVQATQTWVFNQWSAGSFGLYDVLDDAGFPLADPDPRPYIIPYP